MSSSEIVCAVLESELDEGVVQELLRPEALDVGPRQRHRAWLPRRELDDPV